MPEKQNLNNNSELDKSSIVTDTLANLNAHDKRRMLKNIESVNEEKPKKKLNFFLVIVGLQITLFLVALDSCIIGPILPHIGSEFNQMKSVYWVATAFLLPFVVFLPLVAKFSDIFGRKLIILSGIVTFLVGSLLCGVSTSLVMLIICRVITGIGGAGLHAMVYVIITDLVPLEKRGSYNSIANSVFVLACILGPLVGGSLTDYVSWRWCFYINIPIGAVAIVDLFLVLKLPVPQGNFMEKVKRIDYLGALLVLVSGTLFLLSMNFGGAMYPWKSAAVIVPLVLAIILLVIFIYVETKVEEPLMPPRLFKNVSLVSVLATNWLLGMCNFGLVYYLPIYFQVIYGDSAMWSGIRLIPMLAVLDVLACFSGAFISKTGIFMPLLPLGMALASICVGLLSLFNENTSFSVIYGITVIGGVGMAFMYSAPSIAIQVSVEPKDIAIALGLGDFSRILGGAFSVAICSAILNTSLSKELFRHVPAHIAQKILDSSEYVHHGCPPEYFEAVLACYAVAFRMVWYTIAAMCCIGFFCSLNVKNTRIRKVTTDKLETLSSSGSGDHPHKTDVNSVTVSMEMPKNNIKHYHGAALNATDS